MDWMTSDLEQALWAHVSAGGFARDWIRQAMRDGRIRSAKQDWRTLEKWERKGLYESGAALDLGWVVRGAGTKA